MSQETEEFEKELKQIKKRQEEYYEKVRSGLFCAVCEHPIQITPLAGMGASTCKDCELSGLSEAFRKGVFCGIEFEKRRQKP